MKNEEQDYTRTKLTTLYVLYGIFGGLYHSQRYPPWIKKLWTWLAPIVNTLSAGMIIAFLILFGKEDLTITIYAFGLFLLCIYCGIIVPFTTYFFRDEIETVLELNDEEIDDKSIDTHESEYLLRFIYKNYICTALSYFGTLALYLCIPLVTTDENYYRNIELYVFPNPFINQVDTMLKYMICNIFSFSFFVFTCIIANLLGTIMSVIAYEFYASFERWSKNINTHSENFKRSVEELNEKYFHGKLIPESGISEYKRDLETQRQQFMTNINGLIRDFGVTMK